MDAAAQCALNISEGRDQGVIAFCAEAATGRAHVLDVHSDPDHNRTVITFAGSPDDVVESAFDVTAAAVSSIDVSRHDGVHPRLGAADVIPFVPLGSMTLTEAADCARRCGERIARDLSVPVFYYGAASEPPADLPAVRSAAFGDLAPSAGPPTPHPSAGAACVGARGLLVAFNVVVECDLATAKAVAAAVRRPGIRALGLPLPSRGAVQVSMNLTDPLRVGVDDAYTAVAAECRGRQIVIAQSEVVGVIPRGSLNRDWATLLLGSAPKVLEDELARVGLRV